MTEPVKKAYKVRLYPIPKQETHFNKTIGCARWVYNHFLAWHIEVYKAEKLYLRYRQCSEMLTQIKAAPGTE